MDRLHGILVFLRVVEAGNLSAAARALGVSTAAVSAALARLERKLAVRLLDRTTRRLAVTAEGAEFYARCKQIASDLEEAELTVGRAGRMPSGRLKVGMPSALGRQWIVPHLPQFVRDYPAVSLEIAFTDFVPHSMEEGLDAAVQVGELQNSRLAVHRLGSTRYVLCAAPGYVAERGAPRTPDELIGRACLTYRRPRNGRLREWRFRKGASTRHIAVTGVMTFNSGEALVAAAVAGLGIIQVAEYYARSYLDSGQLVELLTDYETESYDISVVFPQHQRVAPKLRAFIDFLVELFDAPPWNGVRPLRRTAVRPKRRRSGLRRPAGAGAGDAAEHGT
jgi:LysR family transcriptional regulator for bpeEF and oprC